MDFNRPSVGFPWILFLFLCAVILFLCSGCSSMQTPLNDNNAYYVNDMTMVVNGVPCNGVCKATKAKQGNDYTIQISTADTIHQIVISSCARTDLPAPSSIGSKRKGYLYIYRPGALERDPGCNLAISGYSKDKGVISSGLIVFDNPKFTLHAGVSCNGRPDYEASGTAICQAMKGQRAMVWFAKKVRLSPRKILKPSPIESETEEDRRCQINQSPDGITWKFILPSRECNYLFESASPPYTQFLLYTIGAEKISIKAD